MTKTISLAAALSALLLAACGGEKDAKTGNQDSNVASGDKAAKPGGKAAKPGAWVELSLPKLGLVTKAPANAKVGAMGGIQSADWKCRLDVFAKGSTSPTFENMVTNIEKGNKGGPLKEMKVKEKTDEDTWTVQWTTEKKFGFASSRKIGSQTISCINFQATSAEAIDCSKKMCNSLKEK